VLAPILAELDARWHDLPEIKEAEGLLKHRR
jgi:hypothetical protein